jgi:hypothetical protein
MFQKYFWFSLLLGCGSAACGATTGLGVVERYDASPPEGDGGALPDSGADAQTDAPSTDATPDTPLLWACVTMTGPTFCDDSGPWGYFPPGKMDGGVTSCTSAVPCSPALDECIVYTTNLTGSCERIEQP